MKNNNIQNELVAVAQSFIKNAAITVASLLALMTVPVTATAFVPWAGTMAFIVLTLVSASLFALTLREVTDGPIEQKPPFQ